MFPVAFPVETRNRTWTVVQNEWRWLPSPGSPAKMEDLSTRWCPSSFNKMVHRWLITPKTMVYYTYNHITIVFMGFINQLVTGGHHIVGNSSAKMGDLSNNMQNEDG